MRILYIRMAPYFVFTFFLFNGTTADPNSRQFIFINSQNIVKQYRIGPGVCHYYFHFFPRQHPDAHIERGGIGRINLVSHIFLAADEFFASVA